MTVERVAVGLLLLSLLTNAGLVYRLRQQAERYQAYFQVNNLGIGNHAPTLEVSEMGRPSIVAPSESRDTVIYAYSKACSACEANLEPLRRMASQIASRVDLVFIAVEGPSYAAEEMGLPMKARYVEKPSPRTSQDYRMGSTPQTVVVRRGKIVANWVGSYRGKNLVEIERALGVTNIPAAGDAVSK